jgi:hypothetical protein
VELTEELLAEVLAAAPAEDAHRVLRDADLRGVRFEGEARFDRAGFQGQAWSDWACFRRGALFCGRASGVVPCSAGRASRATPTSAGPALRAAPTFGQPASMGRPGSTW